MIFLGCFTLSFFKEEEMNMMAACALFSESAELEKELLLKVLPEFCLSKV